MKITRKEASPRYERDSIESFLLVSSLTTDSKNISISIVEMAAYGYQHIHAHEPEQMYYILEGEGIITVNKEEKKVSAASPSFSREACQELWPLENYK